MTRDEIIKELHEIRHKRYEEEKGLSYEEIAERTNKRGRDVVKKYGLKIKTSSLDRV